MRWFHALLFLLLLYCNTFPGPPYLEGADAEGGEAHGAVDSLQSPLEAFHLLAQLARALCQLGIDVVVRGSVGALFRESGDLLLNVF